MSGEGPPNRPPPAPRGNGSPLFALAWLLGAYSRAAPARLRIFSGFPGGAGRHHLLYASEAVKTFSLFLLFLLCAKTSKEPEAASPPKRVGGGAHGVIGAWCERERERMQSVCVRMGECVHGLRGRGTRT
eukprot:5641846-Prymnesium_polylepis.1